MLQAAALRAAINTRAAPPFQRRAWQFRGVHITSRCGHPPTAAGKGNFLKGEMSEYGEEVSLAMEQAGAQSTADTCVFHGKCPAALKSWNRTVHMGGQNIKPEVGDDTPRGKPPERAVTNWSIVHTDFASPPAAAAILSAVKKLAYVNAVAWGGFAQAERCRIVMGHEDMMDGSDADPGKHGGVAAVRVEGTFMFDTANHQDFLGAALGLGIKREVVGDILLQGDRGAVIMTTPEIAPFLELHLTKVRSVPVVSATVPLSELNVPAPRTKTVKSVEASLRLDAVASAGFSMSREKMSKMIKAGDVRVNWQSVLKPTAMTEEGDVISCRGKGRVEIKNVAVTKKQRYAVEMLRYL